MLLVVCAGSDAVGALFAFTLPRSSG